MQNVNFVTLNTVPENLSPKTRKLRRSILNGAGNPGQNGTENPDLKKALAAKKKRQEVMQNLKKKKLDCLKKLPVHQSQWVHRMILTPDSQDIKAEDILHI